MKTKKTFFKTFAIVLSFVCASLFIGCRACSKSAVYLDTFGTITSIYLDRSAVVESDFKDIIDLANTTFDLPDDNVDPAENGSELFKFNKNQNFGTPIAVSQTFIEALSQAKEFYNLDKKFNPAGYKLSELWNFMPYSAYLTAQATKPNPPDDDVIEDALANINFGDLIIDTVNNTVTKSNQCEKLDLTGMIKGWLVDKIAEKLAEFGQFNGYIQSDVSSIRILGGVDYLRIKHPRNPSFSSDYYPSELDKGNLIKFNTSGKRDINVSTSGDYQTYYTDSTLTKRCHIIDPSTGKPIETNTSSVTVIGGSGAMADALSTALCCYKYDNNAQDDPQGLKKQLERLVKKSQMQGVIIFAVSSNQDGRGGYVLTNAEAGTYNVMDSSYKVVNLSV